MPTRHFSDLSPRRRTLVVAVGAVQIALLIAAQVAISRRSASQVRNSKIRWRVLSLINTVGPLAYFGWGRLPDQDGRYGT
jgi:hypothetical protein